MSQSPITPPPTPPMSAATQWAAFAIRQQLAEIQKRIPQSELHTKSGSQDANIDLLYPILETQHDTTIPDVDHFDVGIIGAGAAGLFTALIFDYLNDKFELNVKYEILEATDRIGGRLYTHKFELPTPKDGENEDPELAKIKDHLYYDVGAMRFPENDVMKRTFELFHFLKMEKVELKDAKVGDLIPYYLYGKNIPSLYNDVQKVSPDPDPNSEHYNKDPLNKLTATDFNITDLPQRVMKVTPGGVVSDSIEIFTSYYKHVDNKEKFWKKLISQADSFTVRQWLRQTENFDHNTIEFLETLNFGTGWYDQGLSEMILEELDFDAKKFRCVLGGAQRIADRMAGALDDEKVIEKEKVVTAMSYIPDKKGKLPRRIAVTIKGEDEPRTYDAVFNSATLGAMQRMELEGLNLNWGIKQAIRSLGYGASCKVGILFKSHWWRDPAVGLDISEGGVAKTDRPIRCCVYPSYNIEDPPEKPGVLLVSYTWSQEAQRIGALINRKSPDDEEDLKKVLFHDLARLHAKDDEEYQHLLKIITESYSSHFAYNWSQNPHSVGAFAYFGPGQFQNMYPWITRSGGSNHIIIGEAASAHHAWVVGALESAVRGVYQFLNSHGRWSIKATAAARAFERTGAPPESYENDEDKRTIPAPFGPLPAEYNWQEDTIVNTQKGPDPNAIVSAPNGALARLQVLMEEIRLDQGGDKIDTDKVTKDDFYGLLVGAETEPKKVEGAT